MNNYIKIGNIISLYDDFKKLKRDYIRLIDEYTDVVEGSGELMTMGGTAVWGDEGNDEPESEPEEQDYSEIKRRFIPQVHTVGEVIEEPTPPPIEQPEETEDEGSEGEGSEDEEPEDEDFDPIAEYYDDDTEPEEGSVPELFSTSTPSLEITSTTSTTINFNATYPSSGSEGNCIYMLFRR